VLKILHDKGVKLSQLARVANLAFDGQAFVVSDGQDLCVCREAAARSLRWCGPGGHVRRSICPRSERIL
jgi:hypothetical protein